MTCVRHWSYFCKMKKVNKYNMTLNKCLDFFEFLTTEVDTPLKCLPPLRSFVTVCNKLAGTPFSESDTEILKKSLNAVLNKNPSKAIPAPICWDVNIMLDYLSKLPPNRNLDIKALGGKLAILMLLSTMCRISEVTQLRISDIQPVADGSTVTLHLQELTKVYSIDRLKNTELQKLTLRCLDDCPQICPVTTLIDYLKCSQPLRRGEDKLFIISGSYRGKHFGPAHKQTICRWIKEHFKAVGLENFSTHSTRSSSSTNALLMGMSLDEIDAKVGWLSSNTFVTYYMKPLEKFKNSMAPISTSDIGDGAKLVEKLITTKQNNLCLASVKRAKKKKRKKALLESTSIVTPDSVNIPDLGLPKTGNDKSPNKDINTNASTTGNSTKCKPQSKAVQLWKEKFMRLWQNDPRFKLPKLSKSSTRTRCFISKNKDISKLKCTNRKWKRKADNCTVPEPSGTSSADNTADNKHLQDTSVTDEIKTLDSIMTPEFIDNVLGTDNSTDNSEFLDTDMFDCIPDLSSSGNHDTRDSFSNENSTQNYSELVCKTVKTTVHDYITTPKDTHDSDILLNMEDIPLTDVPMPNLTIDNLEKVSTLDNKRQRKQKDIVSKGQQCKSWKKKFHDGTLKFVYYFPSTSPAPPHIKRSVHQLPKVPQLSVSTSISAPKF